MDLGSRLLDFLGLGDDSPDILGVDLVIEELLVLPVDFVLRDLDLGLLLGELPLKWPILPLLPQVVRS